MITEFKNFLILIAMKSIFWFVGGYVLIFGIFILFFQIYDIGLSLFTIFIGIGMIAIGSDIEQDDFNQ